MDTVKPLRAALYLRVSTEMQIDKDSLPMQERDLRYYATNILNIPSENIDVFKDAGYSAKNTARPAFQEMRAAALSGKYTHVIAWKLDRFSRNLIDFVDFYQELKTNKVALISKTESFDTSSAIGEAIMKIIVIFAELERQMTVMRVSAVMLDRAKQGIWNGGPPPFGYMKKPQDPNENTQDNNNRKLPDFPIPDPHESVIVHKIFELYAKIKSLHKSALAIADLGYRSREGHIISPAHINRVLDRRFYLGEYVYNKQIGNRQRTIRPKDQWIIVKGTHEPIVEEELFNKCKEIKSKNRSFSRKPGQISYSTTKHIFGGYIYCSHCQHTLVCNVVPSRTRPPEERASRYCCNNRFNIAISCDAKKSLSELKLVPWVLALIARIIDACNRPQEFHSDIELTNFLLQGIFDEAVGFVEQKDLFRAVRSRIKRRYASLENEIDKFESNDFVIKDLEQELKKQQRAFDRLSDIMLFSDSGMLPEAFKEKASQITIQIQCIEQQIKDLKNPGTQDADDAFLAKAQELALLKTIQNINSDYEFYPILKAIGRKTLRDFIHMLISRVELDENKVHKIVFTNGFSLTFIYK